MSNKIRNLNGTATYLPPKGYTSWLDFWEKNAHQKATVCSCCYNMANVGGHVKKVGENDKLWYITPLCYKCNGQSSTQIMIASEPLVPVVLDK